MVQETMGLKGPVKKGTEDCNRVKRQAEALLAIDDKYEDRILHKNGFKDGGMIDE